MPCFLRNALAGCFLSFAFLLPALAEPETVLPSGLREQAVDTLRRAMAEEPEWVKVHAAEALLSLGHPEGVKEAFEAERARDEQKLQYRIGIWRVLARAAQTQEERAVWVGKILDVFFHPDSEDRMHSIETLAKLGYGFPGEEAERAKAMAPETDGAMRCFLYWALAQGGHAGAEAQLAGLLKNEDARTRFCAAYALRHLPGLSKDTVAAVRDAALAEAADSEARVFLVAAAWVLSENPREEESLKADIETYAKSGTKTERYQALSALGDGGAAGDVPFLSGMLEDAEPDVRVASALALLRIARRTPHHLSGLDWLVIAIYGGLMLGVGWYYSRRTATREDYLLGGRNMRPPHRGAFHVCLLAEHAHLFGHSRRDDQARAHDLRTIPRLPVGLSRYRLVDYSVHCPAEDHQRL